MVLLITVIAAAACGKKGPPLAPFSRVPAAPANPAPHRIGSDVYLAFQVPNANVDGRQPADIESVEVYAVTSAKPPETEEQREVASLIATLPVRPILPEIPAPADGTSPPPIPLPPGVDRGSTAVVKETITDALRDPVELPPTPSEIALRELQDETGEEAIAPGPLVAPPPSALPRRHYFVMAVSSRGRKSPPSAMASIALETASAAPGAPQVAYTESELRITWEPPPDARTPTILLPPPPVVPPPPSVPAPPAGGNATPGAPAAPAPGNATPGNTTPPVPVRTGPTPLNAKSLGFNSVATTYNLYEVPPLEAAEDPSTLKLPLPLTPAPLPTPLFVSKSVAFGVERCFGVRPVDQVFGVTVQGPMSPVTCITPIDTFPPTAPRSLAAIAGSGVINLIWEPNPESDLAGYIVLRGEAPGDTLQALTPEPINATSYADTAVRPGARYVYAVVAVDRAVPQNVSPRSNHFEETARQ